MSNKTEEVKTEKAVKGKKPGAGEGKKPAEHHARATTKSKWSLERCEKYAHRFQNEAAWENGNPSSYKAAKAHGWVAQCMGHPQKTNRKAS